MQSPQSPCNNEIYQTAITVSVNTYAVFTWVLRIYYDVMILLICGCGKNGETAENRHPKFNKTRVM